MRHLERQCKHRGWHLSGVHLEYLALTSYMATEFIQSAFKCNLELYNNNWKLHSKEDFEQYDFIAHTTV